MNILDIMQERHSIRSYIDKKIHGSVKTKLLKFRKAKTKEEQDFYVMLSNLVLKREVEKVIGK